MIRFGRDKCNVADAERVIDRIAQGMDESWKENHSILTDSFAQKLGAAWTEGRRSAQPNARVIFGMAASDPIDGDAKNNGEHAELRS
ncbi:hypothetical protein [Variovorax sp. J31P207]|uniref:hypothetical protein n=1 Tax=Variovorax sp. J31P207 TaxID=3053510 RepID=UPI0025750352|nr:hypothetical protein [Variovorax sp. J31P207]MDM0071825.1 hypothetical protein [Variovorax sp. J31P207]